ncbi:MAG: hypothetical protein AAFV45_04375 [Pseudomonadota bacterium]
MLTCGLRHGFCSLLVALAIAVPTAAGTLSPHDAAPVWEPLHRHEVAALRAYNIHITTDDVGQRAKTVFELAEAIERRAPGHACGDAARTLSIMIRGYVESSRRLETSRDWAFFQPRYAEK